MWIAISPFQPIALVIALFWLNELTCWTIKITTDYYSLKWQCHCIVSLSFPPLFFCGGTAPRVSMSLGSRAGIRSWFQYPVVPWAWHLTFESHLLPLEWGWLLFSTMGVSKDYLKRSVESCLVIAWPVGGSQWMLSRCRLVSLFRISRRND